MSQRSKKADLAPTKGLYANYFEVGHTALEVVIDFGQRYDGKGAAACHTRIVTSPSYAEALRHTLEQALEQYRERYGVPK